MNESFIAKSRLLLFISGFILWGIGLILNQDDVAVLILLFTLIISFVLAFYSRKNKIATITMKITGGLIILGILNLIIWELS